jgi:hypothetical protein
VSLAEELDLHHAQPGVGEYGLHARDFQAGRGPAS